MKAGTLIACLLLWTDTYGPLQNTPLTNLYTEVKVEICTEGRSAVVVSTRTFQEVQGVEGPARYYFGNMGMDFWWSKQARRSLLVIPDQPVSTP